MAEDPPRPSAVPAKESGAKSTSIPLESPYPPESSAGPSRYQSPERPKTGRTITNDRLSIDAFIARKGKFRRSSLGRWILGSKAEKTVREKRNGERVKGGSEPPEDGEDDVDDLLGGPDAFEQDDALRLTQHWLEDHNIPIGEATADGDHGKSESVKWAWDVLYENQFGIYIFGKPHFSSGLIPFGSPTAFTLTAAPNSHAAEVTVSGLMSTSAPVPTEILPGSTPGHPEVKKMTVRDWKKSQYLTKYTSKNKPLPSPEWEAVTPWMINMTPGTDEAGWRYNWRWRAKGWKSHAGGLGWGGWCRRRQWLKLVHFAPEERVSEISPTEAKLPPWASKAEEDEHRREEKDAEERLKRICKHHTAGDNLHALLKALGKVPLDRRKLELWDDWLSNADPEDRNKLEEVLSLPDAVSKPIVPPAKQQLDELRFTFTFSASFTDFLAVLQKHNFEFKLVENPSDDTDAHQLPAGPPAQPAVPYTLTGP